MKEQLLKLFEGNQLVDMIYVAKSNEVSKRRIKITKVNSDTFCAYCFLKQAKRTFTIDNVLALAPVTGKERRAI